MNIQVIGPGRHRRLSLIERIVDRPLAALLVAAGTGVATPGIIEFLRLVA